MVVLRPGSASPTAPESSTPTPTAAGQGMGKPPNISTDLKHALRADSYKEL